jgi:hypothetical protein
LRLLDTEVICDGDGEPVFHLAPGNDVMT